MSFGFPEESNTKILPNITPKDEDNSLNTQNDKKKRMDRNQIQTHKQENKTGPHGKKNAKNYILNPSIFTLWHVFVGHALYPITSV